MSPDIIITSRPQLLRYLADELDTKLYDQLVRLGEQEMEDQLIKRASNEVKQLQQNNIIIQDITSTFFSDRKGFKREFHLILFPFFTAFVHSLECLEIDSATIINRHFLIPHFNSISATTKRQLLKTIDQWAIHYSSLDDLTSSSCERFIWFLSNFMDRLSAISSTNKGQHDAHQQLGLSISQALMPLLSVIEPWDEEIAAIHMAKFLENLVTPLLPNQNSFIAKVNFSNRHRYLSHLTHLLEEEREHYQHQLTAVFTPVYHQCYADLEHAWHLYRQQFNQHLTRLSNYLDNLLI